MSHAEGHFVSRGNMAWPPWRSHLTVFLILEFAVQSTFHYDIVTHLPTPLAGVVFIKWKPLSTTSTLKWPDLIMAPLMIFLTWGGSNARVLQLPSFAPLGHARGVCPQATPSTLSLPMEYFPFLDVQVWFSLLLRSLVGTL